MIAILWVTESFLYSLLRDKKRTKYDQKKKKKQYEKRLTDKTNFRILRTMTKTYLDVT